MLGAGGSHSFQLLVSRVTGRVTKVQIKDIEGKPLASFSSLREAGKALDTTLFHVFVPISSPSASNRNQRRPLGVQHPTGC
uniref:Uncharacterized protein n=1 Tax=Rhizoctonia solani TaxID=456999 RepID=N0A347_9AGAM|nr:hypothetical protein RSOL_m00360 [Rhizoctonia solani]AGK45371.1 hypothetical protein RSOL_m00360 [Rhizoctonia solani]